MTSALENLAGSGKSLRAEPPDANEFAGLQRSGLARLKDVIERDDFWATTANKQLNFVQHVKMPAISAPR